MYYNIYKYDTQIPVNPDEAPDVVKAEFDKMQHYCSTCRCGIGHYEIVPEEFNAFAVYQRLADLIADGRRFRYVITVISFEYPAAPIWRVMEFYRDIELNKYRCHDEKI